MIKWLQFYETLDKKMNRDLTAIILGISSIILTALITIFGTFNPEAPILLIIILNFLFVILSMLLLYGFILFLKNIYNWFENELKPKFKETQNEFEYTSTNKSKVIFE